MDKRQVLGQCQGILAHSSSHFKRSLEELRGAQPQEGQHVVLTSKVRFVSVPWHSPASPGRRDRGIFLISTDCRFLEQGLSRVTKQCRIEVPTLLCP